MVKEVVTNAAESAATPFRIDVASINKSVGRRNKERVILHNVSLSIQPKELVAVVGGSGAGKTTLLNAMAGVTSPSTGQVLYNGQSLYKNISFFRSTLGYVPQDDIVHKELTVERTLHYAARMRLPAGLTDEERDARADETIQSLGLTAQKEQRVGSLSGGQRKRVSIGVELLTKPGVFFLDEPTSGLDPATGRDMMRLLRSLADSGSTVVLTTHAPQDIRTCDKVLFLTRGGYLAFFGPPKRSLEYFNTDNFDAIYERLTNEGTPEQWAQRFISSPDSTLVAIPSPASSASAIAGGPDVHPKVPQTASFMRQWLVLTQRAFEILWRNTLTLSILAGSPVAVVLMFAVLFRPGAFDTDSANPSASIMILFWMAFGSFFFGLTYGLLQICVEFPIFFRERLVNLKIAPYVFSKVAILVPILIVVLLLMLVVLKVLLRLPDGGLDMYLPMAVTLFLGSFAALALGLLASAGVSKPDQATLALPMLCFPAVLFSGAILAIPVMAGVGQAIGIFMSNRWTFEALGKSAKLNDLFVNGDSPLGLPLLQQYQDSFSRPVWESWVILGLFVVVTLGMTCVMLRLKSSQVA